eukprot:TRINITY_DN11488_c0_g1_i1.p1 TRINITY_DN11488_c0_g1~~TRINITY_DN11488_c0_g1_i1.p1  ORF type:complete len:349 (+),score=54.75 TRINITY_DN11488_c0_g1_i1:138-1184(+)
MITTSTLRVRTAATVICIRRVPRICEGRRPLTRAEATCGEDAWDGAGGDGPSRMALVFGQGQSGAFHSDWEVLMGQSEVQNWMKSVQGREIAMRYPGEWKFAGGITEPGETSEETAWRELQEEFLLRSPEPLATSHCKLRLLNIKQTRPIRNVSNIMYNFVAAAEENPWLAELDVKSVNQSLALRRQKHSESLRSGQFSGLTKTEQEDLAPEIHQVQWLDMRSAVLHAFTSMNKSFAPVNSFQQQEFQRLGLERRDPMFLTMATLLELDSFPSLQFFVEYSKKICPSRELERIQWLRDGMSPEEVARTWITHMSPTETEKRAGMFQTAEEREALWRKRMREDEARSKL